MTTPLSEWMTLPREKRTAHIDLSTPCVMKDEPRSALVYIGHSALNKLLGIERDIPDLQKFKPSSVHYSHLCECNSQNGWCVNPLHGYWSWSKGENNYIDMSPEKRHSKGVPKTEEAQQRHFDGSSRGGKKAAVPLNGDKWICSDGYMSTVGNCARRLKKTKKPKDFKAKLTDKETEAIRNLPQEERVQAVRQMRKAQ